MPKNTVLLMGHKNQAKSNRVDALRCEKLFYSPTEDADEVAAAIDTDNDSDHDLYTQYAFDDKDYYINYSVCNWAYDQWKNFGSKLYQLWYKLRCQKHGEEQAIIPGSLWSPEIEAELNELLVEMPLSDADFKLFCTNSSTFSRVRRDGPNGGGNARFNNLPARFGCITGVSMTSKHTHVIRRRRAARAAREASDSIEYPWFAKAVAKLRQDAHEEYEAYLNSPDPTCKGEIRATDPFAPSYLEWRGERFEVGMDLLRMKLAREKRLVASRSPATIQPDKLKSKERI